MFWLNLSVVQPLVMPELKLLISKDWLPGQASNRGVSDETHVILLTMDALEIEKVSSTQAYATFTEFFVNNPELFPAELKKRILNTVIEITDVFTVKNRHLVKLEALFNMTALSNV